MRSSSSISGHVAAVVNDRISLLAPRRSQKEIARMIDMSPTMLSNVKLGRNKLPIEYVPALAGALEVDPRHLMLLAMRESLSERAITSLIEVFGQLVTDNEMEILAVIREASDDADPKLTDDLEKLLVDLFRTKKE